MSKKRQRQPKLHTHTQKKKIIKNKENQKVLEQTDTLSNLNIRTKGRVRVDLHQRQARCPEPVLQLLLLFVPDIDSRRQILTGKIIVYLLYYTTQFVTTTIIFRVNYYHNNIFNTDTTTTNNAGNKENFNKKSQFMEDPIIMKDTFVTSKTNFFHPLALRPHRKCLRGAQKAQTVRSYVHSETLWPGKGKETRSMKYYPLSPTDDVE